MLSAWDVHVAAPETALEKFDISSSIYGSKSVKKRLLKEQYGKCAFCEGRMWAIVDGKPEPILQHGDVEHFRPKGRARQAEDAEEGSHPGYFWLAYDWSNLYMACALCNQVFKRDWFPLEDPAARALPRGDLKKESPLIVSPAEDPSVHLEFEENIIKSKTARGKETIKRTGLDRPGLNDDRRSVLGELKVHVDTIETLKALVDSVPSAVIQATIKERITTITAILWERAGPTQPYSLCVGTYLARSL